MTFEQLIEQLTNKRALLDAQHSALQSEGTSIINAAKTTQRSLTAEENQRALAIVAERTSIRSQLVDLDAQLQLIRDEQAADSAATRAAQERRPGATLPAGGVSRGQANVTERDERDRWVFADSDERAALRPDEQLREHPLFERMQQQRRGEDYMLDRYANLGQLIRTLTTTGTSANVPTIWAADFIDLARNTAAVGRAGASVIPMAAKTVNIARITGDATAAFRLEGGTIAASDPTLDQVILDAKSLSAYVKVTREWMQDADNAEHIVVQALAEALALKIDEVALYGGIVSGDASGKNLPVPPNPRGVLAALSALLPANVLGNATNGTAQTAGNYWGEILDTIYQVRNSNEIPNALIWAIKAEQQYAKATDTTGQPLRIPPAIEGLSRLATKQIPTYTKGTMAARATDVFAGDWSNLLIGERLDLTIEINTQMFADTGHLAVFAHWRGDIQPARPASFAVYRALQGAA